jgi:uncharacterized protein (DUF934 family)
MSRLICTGELIEDRWRWVDADEAPAPAPARPDPAAGAVVRPAARPRRRPHRRVARPRRRRGAAAALAGHAAADRHPFSGVHDGRGYSLARLLRGRHGYAGELRAVGDVLRDQLYFLQRCGFDSFALRADQPPEEPWRPSTTTAGRRSPPADRPRGGGGGHTPHGRFLL